MITSTDDLARVRVAGLDGTTLRVSVPGTSYVLTFDAGDGAAALRGLAGRVVQGRVEAQALRLHRAGGGGRFVEPLIGAPRIIQGLVRAIDQQGRRLLVETAVPMWLTLAEGDRPEEFAEGDLVNCYVASGARWTAVAVDPAR